MLEQKDIYICIPYSLFPFSVTYTQYTIYRRRIKASGHSNSQQQHSSLSKRKHPSELMMAGQKNSPDRDMRRCWNYDFRWTPEHLTQEQMQPLRHTMDNLASDCIEPLARLASDGKTLENSKPNLMKLDMYALLRDNYEKHEALTRLWEQTNIIPDWVDWAQIERGQKVYYRYGHSMGIAVGHFACLHDTFHW